MKIENENQIIEIIDDDPTASENEGGVTEGSASGSRKRKVEDDDVSEKVHWSDDSDGVPVRPKKRRAKRKSAAKNDKKRGKNDGHDAKDELDLGDIPDYLQERRRNFDANKKRYHEAALMLPPDYTDIDFDESRRLGELKERPEFDARSGIKPSRPYKAIELPQSAGRIPASIAQYLRDYQVVGVKFLHRKFVYQEGCILGDDMGLGKTVQVAAFLTAAFGKTGDERDDKRMREIRFCPGRWYPRILIICPGSLIMNWRNELNRWGWWHIDIYHGTNKDDIMGTARSGLLEVMITTYDTYKNNRSAINMVSWDACIADECHRLKDRSSETTKAMNEVNALCRIGLTGTAIQNKYEELWTLLDWTNPGHFGAKAEWMQTISKPLTVGQSHDATVAQLSLARQTAKKLVQNLLPRYFLRRMKTLIADQLPKKTDRVVFCPLTDLQAEAYESFLSSDEIHLLRTISDRCPHGKKKGWCCQTHLPDGRRWPALVFPSMITLQKLANHLALLTPSTTDVDTKHKKELETLKLCLPDTWKPLYEQRDQIRNLVNPEFCGKWKVMKKLLRFWHQHGDKVLVFSHSVRLLRILQHLFTSTSYNVSYLDGSLSYEERQDIVDTFNSDPTQFVFLISTKAGGVGLNITSANKVVIVDPHWNPSWDLQAQDRAYRIGQTRDVEVFRLISQGTVEEIVYARQVYKQQQANIGYTASSERRYFKGVQHDEDRKGEIFGLSNIFTYHGTSSLVRNIVNNTNIAEARAGVDMADMDMEQAARDQESLGIMKREDGNADDGGMSQLATLLTAENQQQLLDSNKSVTPKSDAIQAILTSVGVEYTHDNSEVVGTSKVEEQLSRRAAMRSYADGDREGQNALFADGQEEDDDDMLHNTYRPPEDVRLRQFCSMAREFGFVNATEFALVVESWSQEARRNCLDTFYRRREAALDEAENVKMERAAEEAAEAMFHDEDVPGGVKREFAVQVKDEDTKDVKEEHIKGGVKGEGIKAEDVKSEDLNADVKSEGVKAEVFKEEDTKVNVKTESNLKHEATSTTDMKSKTFKVEGTSKRNSIFISDDDDDEL
ncbi:DNA excision repair protein [Pochonia chlamydosporia 170]|uniref:DNA excision repair protein n=1 Tax=Pochonia chlamydosporia 170 TaxID=1380566 RepID=A0A179F8Y3_METCM|nr:DNA excision repair protein [Pochonia chlamydosporia 170]OAQ61741.1 DNA excision repair protein [Pochonia chlamydosporia 170]